MYRLGFLFVILLVSLELGESFPRSKKQACPNASCDKVRCVDPELDNNGCCMTCPNGNNCVLFGDLWPADQYAVFSVGSCQWTCSCPGQSVYGRDGQNTVAACSMICGNDYYSPSEVAEYYNLLEPLYNKRQLSKKSVIRQPEWDD